jgi:hypothetical protein
MLVICPTVSLFLVIYLVTIQIIKLLYVTSSSLLLLRLLRPKFILHHPVLQHRRPMFFASCKSPPFTSTHTHTKVYPTCIWASVLSSAATTNSLTEIFVISLICPGRYQDCAFNQMLPFPQTFLSIYYFLCDHSRRFTIWITVKEIVKLVNALLEGMRVKAFVA